MTCVNKVEIRIKDAREMVLHINIATFLIGVKFYNRVIF